MAARIGHIEINRYTAGLAALFLVGLVIFAYPFVNNWRYQMQADNQIASYSQAVDARAQGNAAYDDAFAAAQEYNRQLVGQVVPDVFAIREGTVDADYEAHLNILGDQMMGSVEIPAIDVRLPIYHYSTEQTLLKGCGHIFGSSLPVGGESSHAVITAHRGLPSAAMFSDLDQVRKGDRFFLHILDRTLAYEVDQIEVVEPQETRSLAIERGEDLCTLVTCTPYGVNTERLLVRGHRVAYEPGDEAASTSPRLLGWATKIAVAAAGVLLALALLWAYSRWRRRRQDTAAAIGLDGDNGVEVAAELENANASEVRGARHRG